MKDNDERENQVKDEIHTLWKNIRKYGSDDTDTLQEWLTDLKNLFFNKDNEYINYKCFDSYNYSAECLDDTKMFEDLMSTILDHFNIQQPEQWQYNPKNAATAIANKKREITDQQNYTLQLLKEIEQLKLISKNT